MTTVSLQIVGIIEPIIQHADWFFPGGQKKRTDRQWSAIWIFIFLFFYRNLNLAEFNLWIFLSSFILFVLEIEFNVTGNYGSPVHTNHNANYSLMPSPDLDQVDRRQNDQSRRPLSVATDNMMLEFYKKDGYESNQLNFQLNV